MPEGTKSCFVLMTEEYHKLVQEYQEWVVQRGGDKPAIADLLVKGGYEKMKREMGKSFKDIK